MKKNKKWKPGQLVTLDGIVYRVTKFDCFEKSCSKYCDYAYKCHNHNRSSHPFRCISKIGMKCIFKRVR